MNFFTNGQPRFFHRIFLLSNFAWSELWSHSVVQSSWPYSGCWFCYISMFYHLIKSFWLWCSVFVENLRFDSISLHISNQSPVSPIPLVILVHCFLGVALVMPWCASSSHVPPVSSTAARSKALPHVVKKKKNKLYLRGTETAKLR